VNVYVFALLLGVLIITVEFRHKTVTTSFLTTPHRTRFVLGKILMAALAGAALAVVVLVGTVVGGGIALSAKGGSFSDMAHQIGAVAPGMILVYALFAVLGVGVGSLLTNQVAAIVVCLGWFLILENIIGGIWEGTVRWLPSGAALAASSVSAGGANSIGLFTWWQGSLLILAYGLAFAAVGSLLLTRRDIT
jgi:ABC-type transport system involved in multi-copper enzyme maturation permease subunit